MAKYFYDTEFLEGTQKKLFGKTDPTIDLISIGIVCEDGREFYAISKDFNLKEAWNRYDIKREQVSGDMRNLFPNGITKKVYWIRENVLKPIYYDWVGKDVNFHEVNHFTYKNFKRLLKKHGKSNKQIANEIKSFCNGYGDTFQPLAKNDKNIEFYGYYSAYDHVALCWLFGKMIDLPTGFPMYTIDLKQELDNIVKHIVTRDSISVSGTDLDSPGFDDVLEYLKKGNGYPKQTNEHNALSDAKWNFELYKFLNN